MVNVVVRRVVGGDELKWVPWEVIAAVVVDRLDGGHCKEPHGLTRCQASNEECHAGSGSIQQKTLHGMVVQCAKGIRDVKSMMTGVEFHY